MNMEEDFKRLEAQIHIASDKLDAFAKQAKQLEDALSLIQQLQADQVIRVPLVDGIFIETKVVQTSDLLVHTGANVVVKKDAQFVIELLQKQLDQTHNYQEQLTQKLIEYSQKADALQQQPKEGK